MATYPGKPWTEGQVAEIFSDVYYIYRDGNWQHLEYKPPVLVSANYVAGDSDNVILVDSEIVITLPQASAANSGKKIVIKRINTTGNVTINVSGGGTIDGDTTHTLAIQYSSVTVISDRNNWFII